VIRSAVSLLAVALLAAPGVAGSRGSSVMVPTVERGFEDAAFCSIEMVGARPRIES